MSWLDDAVKEKKSIIPKMVNKVTAVSIRTPARFVIDLRCTHSKI